MSEILKLKLTLLFTGILVVVTTVLTGVSDL